MVVEARFTFRDGPSRDKYRAALVLRMVQAGWPFWGAVQATAMTSDDVLIVDGRDNVERALDVANECCGVTHEVSQI